MIGESRSSSSSGAMSVEQIEREFARLRVNEDGTLGLRASVLNLIVVTDEESAEHVTQTVSRLSGRFPSRAIVFISDPDEQEANLDIRLSAYCSVRGDGGQVCAEQVTIHAEGPPAHHLESLAGPLLLPDLPVFLWYPGAFSPGMPPFESMVALADRLVIDTAATGDQALCLREMAVMLEGEGIPEVGDLQWVGLSPWRTLIAELFSPPERARELEEIRHVEVLHNPDGESRALLLVGWLASSLGWRPQRASRTGEGREILFDAPAGEIAVEMSSNSPDASLRRVRLYGKELSFQVSRHRELAEAASTVMREGELMAGRTTHLGSFDPATILGEELQYRGRDLYYRAALKTVAEILDL